MGPLGSLPSTAQVALNFVRTRAPAASDDISAGYTVGSYWTDTTTQKTYLCTANTLATAVWSEVTAAPLTEPAPIAGQGYSLVFEDHFTNLDTALWRLNPWFEAENPAYFEQSGSSVFIHCKSANSYQHTGLMFRNQDHAFQYGYFEARMRYTRDRGSWPAWWMMSDNWIRTGVCTTYKISEYDIFEGFHNNEATLTYRSHSGTLHRNTTNQCGMTDSFTSNWTADTGYVLADNWRTYAGLWTSTTASTYVEDKLLKSWPVWDTTNQPMRPMCTLQHHAGVTSPADLVLEVDWIRIWQK